MKDNLTTVKKLIRLGVIIYLPLIILSSCTKYNIDPTPASTTALSVVDASPDSQPLDFYVGPTQINLSPIYYGSGINYFNTTAGKVSLGFYGENTQVKIASDTVTLNTNSAYTLYLTNLISKPDFILLKDTITPPPTQMATIRFVNVSPDAPAVDFAERKGAVLATHRIYKTYTTFIPIHPKVNDTLEIRQAGTNTVLASVPSINVQSGIVYTVWLYGLANTQVSSQKLQAGLFINFSYNL